MIEIVQGDCAAFVDVATDCDALITDPPYASFVHSCASSHNVSGKRDVYAGRRKRDLGFASIESGDAAHTLARYVAGVQKWAAVFSDIESVGGRKRDAEALGARHIRSVAWVRWSMPQLSGDRPPQGSEIVSLYHSKVKGGATYNGPGNLTHWDWGPLRIPTAERHPTEKPLPLMLDLVSWFTLPGDTVIDPFAGAGTTALACALLGRHCIAIERDPSHVERMRGRLGPVILERDRVQIRAWLEGSPARPSANAAKAAHRREDFERATKALNGS